MELQEPIQVTLPCADGTDPECVGEMTHGLPLVGLTDEQIAAVLDGEGDAWIGLTPEQVEINQENLSPSEKKSPPDDGLIMVQIALDTTCCFCGSDQ